MTSCSSSSSLKAPSPTQSHSELLNVQIPAHEFGEGAEPKSMTRTDSAHVFLLNMYVPGIAENLGNLKESKFLGERGNTDLSGVSRLRAFLFSSFGRGGLSLHSCC